MQGRQHPPGRGECARGSEPPIRPCPPHGAGISRASTLSVMIAAVLTRSGWDSAMECEPPSLPTVDDGSRDDALRCLNMPSCPGYRHDFGALRAASAGPGGGSPVPP